MLCNSVRAYQICILKQIKCFSNSFRQRVSRKEFYNGSNKFQVLSVNAYFITIKSTVLALMNKPAKFIVTPKVNEHITFLHAIRIIIKESYFQYFTIACIAISEA